MLIKRSVLLAGVQTAVGTPAALKPENAVLVEALQCNPVNQRMIDRPVIRKELNKPKQIYGGHLQQLSCTVELKGSGTAGVAPEIGALLQICGYSEDVVADTSVTYKAVSEGHKAGTIEYYDDGNLTRMTDARGEVTFDLTAGSYGKASFTITGHVEAVTTGALPNVSYANTTPPVLIGLSNLQVGGSALELNQIAINTGNEVVTPGSIRSADGYGEIRIASRDINGTIDPEDQLANIRNFVKEWTDGTEASLVTGTVGSQEGNRWQMTLPKIHWRDVQPGERDQVRTKQLTFGAMDDAGDDAITLAFT